MNMKRMSLIMALTCLSLEAGQVADLGRDGVGLVVEAEPEVVDVGRDVEVTVRATAPAGRKVLLPDLRDRFGGFRVAEDFAEEPQVDAEGRTTLVTRWRLVPEPLATRYRLAPFVVTVTSPEGQAERTFYTRAVVFAPPPPCAAVAGAMEIHPTRDFPALSWRLVGLGAAALAGLAALGALVFLVVRRVRLMVKIHRMSPIERALYELDVLLKKGLPGRGLYKDFYVELTMVVRRYIERRHDVRAPNLTTEEFLRAAQANAAFSPEAIAVLKTFLESADMVKFAGVEATSEMADAATGKAKAYLEADNRKEG